METDPPKTYKRVLLKLSGEALVGTAPFGIHMPTLEAIAQNISAIANKGLELALVIGGGNIFRGMAASATGMDRTTADYMGMLATLMNAMAVQDALEKQGLDTRLISAISMKAVAEDYIRRRAVRHLSKGRVVIFSAGTGNPYFTTDTTAALRAAEIQADIVLKGTKVDGVYDKDPMKHDDAVRYESLSYTEVLSQRLNVMDGTAIALCRDNSLPILVFNMTDPGNIVKAACGEAIGTLVRD